MSTYIDSCNWFVMLCKVFIEKLTVSFLQYGLFHWRNIFFKCFLEQLTHSSFKSCMCFGVLTKDNIFLLSKFFVRNFGMQQPSASKQAASLLWATNASKWFAVRRAAFFAPYPKEWFSKNWLFQNFENFIFV